MRCKIHICELANQFRNCILRIANSLFNFVLFREKSINSEKIYKRNINKIY